MVRPRPPSAVELKAPGPVHAWRPHMRTHAGALLLDVLQLAEEPPPQAGQELRVWPRGTQESCTVRPVHVEPLLRLWVQQGQVTAPSHPPP